MFVSTHKPEEEPVNSAETKSDEEFDKLKDSPKEKESPKKIKREVKRTPKVRCFLFVYSSFV